MEAIKWHFNAFIFSLQYKILIFSDLFLNKKFIQSIGANGKNRIFAADFSQERWVSG